MKLLDLIKQFGQANYNCGFFNQQSGELTKKYEIERQKYFDEIVGQIDLRVSLQNADGWSVRNKVGEPKETDKIEQTEKQVKVESEVIQLLREFFNNKDKMKEIKNGRNDLWEMGGGCTGSTIDCIEAKRNNSDATLCPFCEKRNNYFLQLKKLKVRNVGILRSLRAKVG